MLHYQPSSPLARCYCGVFMHVPTHVAAKLDTSPLIVMNDQRENLLGKQEQEWKRLGFSYTSMLHTFPCKSGVFLVVFV